MAKPEDDLLDVFDDIVAAGYSNPSALGPYFDENIVLFRLGQKDSVQKGDQLLIGKKTVLDYIRNHLVGELHAQFNPTSKVPFVSPGGAFGQVTGKADWHDDDGDKDGTISYAFAFRKNQAGGPSWLLLALWGSSD
jgi:hypothetical protein